MPGFKSEVLVGESEWVGNGIVWPDEESALSAGRELLSRWYVPVDHRAVPTDQEPTRPTWTEYLANPRSAK